MSPKTILLLVAIVVLGAFAYLKFQASGDPNSQFNQTTRYALGRYPLLRTVLGLHSVGDARGEYLAGGGLLTIEWLKPTDEDINQSLVQSFADLAAKYLGRPTQLVYGGAVSDGTIPLSNLETFKLRANAQRFTQGPVLIVFFVQDYSPRQDKQLSTGYGESTMVVSLNAYRTFLVSHPQDLYRYLQSALLYELGRQIGLREPTGDNSCIMDMQNGMNSQSINSQELSAPQDFCPQEQIEIAKLKLQY